ncbi:MAG: diacylglycerol kinase family protein [Candidatus Marinimicrobia bacterium]|nr:diacylglycerol kinase family protein [Candidatus Neomarinimicrobiota bacterium]|tara:strand:+ start:668 stop:1558 length:891 start_codon:yes stop_codon:yes gene_type:complete
MKNILCIVNPISGLKKSLKVYYELKDVIESHGFTSELLKTEYAGHAKKVVSELKLNQFNRILIFGGDGTVNEVINGLYQSDLCSFFPIGIIPTGSGNSVVHDIDCLDYNIAIKRALSDNIRLMDVNKAIFDNEVRLSVSIIGWGMFSFGNVLADKLRFLGTIRYDIASVIKLVEKTLYKAKISIDGETSDISCAFMVGCNSIHTGKGMKIAPLGGFYDEMIDIVIVKDDVSRLQLFAIFKKVYTGEHVDLPYVHMSQVKSFSIDALKDSYFNVDGETIKSRKVSTQILPKTIKLLV